jgi:hypothetical protein
MERAARRRHYGLAGRSFVLSTTDVRIEKGNSASGPPAPAPAAAWGQMKDESPSPPAQNAAQKERDKCCNAFRFVAVYLNQTNEHGDVPTHFMR